MAAPPRLPVGPEADAEEREERGAAVLECPRCGTAAEPYQEYCLECGLRLPPGAAGSGLGGALRSRAPTEDWAWPVLVALVVAVLATAVVVGVQALRGETGPIVATHTTDVGETSAPTETVEEPTVPTETTPTTATTTGQTTTAPPPTGGIVTWPAGKSGYTVVLASVPASGGRAPAVALARKAIKDGLPQVGVLRSADFASLHPGYFVVFTGIYAAARPAERGAATARGRGYRSAYVRQITS